MTAKGGIGKGNRDGSRPNHARPGEKGIRCGVGNSRQIRDCPRNCKRLATPGATGLTLTIGEAGKAGRAETRESGDLPSQDDNDPGGVPRQEYAMDQLKRRPLATPPYSVAQSAPHQILVCKACKHEGSACEPGFALLKKLRAAIAAAGLADAFEVSGTACLAGCVPDRGGPCVVGWRATAKATWLFGDIDPAQSIDDLVAFSRLYAATEDGWMSGKDCPPRLCDNTLARIPAAMIVTRHGTLQ